MDYATQIFAIASAAFTQNFGAVAKLKLAGVKVWSESPDLFYTGGSATTCVSKAPLNRYSEFLVYGKDTYIPYDSKTRTGCSYFEAPTRHYSLFAHVWCAFDKGDNSARQVYIYAHVWFIC